MQTKVTISKRSEQHQRRRKTTTNTNDGRKQSEENSHQRDASWMKTVHSQLHICVNSQGLCSPTGTSEASQQRSTLRFFTVKTCGHHRKWWTDSPSTAQVLLRSCVWGMDVLTVGSEGERGGGTPALHPQQRWDWRDTITGCSLHRLTGRRASFLVLCPPGEQQAPSEQPIRAALDIKMKKGSGGLFLPSCFLRQAEPHCR